MNTDFRVAVGMTTHPKTVKLMRRCGDRAFFCLINLWSWAAMNKPDGDFSGMDREDVEIVAGWNGDFGFFADQLCEIGFMDCEDGNFSLHDWTVHNPWAAGSEDRSDAGRLNRMKMTMPDEYGRLAEAGATGISKADYEAIRRSRKKADTGHPRSPLKAPLKVPLSEPLTPAPAPAPAPAPNTKEYTTPLTPQEGGEEKSGKEQKPESSCPHQKIIEAYHEILPECPRIRVWPKASERQMAARWRESKERQSLEWWRHVFSDVSQSDFLMGRTARDGPFVFSLGWFVKPTNFAKVLNGQYENREQKSSGIRVGGLTF